MLVDHAPELGARPLPRVSRRGMVLAGLSAGVGLMAAAALPIGIAGLRRGRAGRSPMPARPAVARTAVTPVEAAPAAPAAPPPQATPVNTAEATVPTPDFVRRHAWTERGPADNHLAMPRIGRLTVHHTGADTRALGATDLQTVQRIEHYHRDQLGWACIGYHFLIGADGTIYEGRPLALQGAHVRDANRGNLGVSLIGDCHSQTPSPQQLASLQYLLDHARRRYRLSPTDIFGHRDLAPTTCPGDQLYAWLGTYRRELGASDGTILA